MKQKSFLVVIALLSVSTWIDFISILTYVGYEMELSPIGVALVTVSMLAPQALFSKIFSTIISKFNANTLLLISSIIRVLCTVSLIWATTTEILLPILLLRSFALGFLQPIIAGESKRLSSGDESRFASLINLINTLSKIVAPALGGVIAVRFGEASVFVLSSLFGLLSFGILCFYPLSDAMAASSPKKAEEEHLKLPIGFIVGFGVSVFFINGIALMFTNLLPYSFNFYDVPKITLSIALSFSALGGIAVNLLMIKTNPKMQGFPKMPIFACWAIIAVSFAALCRATIKMRIQRQSG